jgi:hypothetical protein
VPSRNDPAASLVDVLENLERIEGCVAGGWTGRRLEATHSGVMQSSGAWNAFAKPAWGKKQLSWRRASPGAISVVWATDCVTLTTVSTSMSCGTPSKTGCLKADAEQALLGLKVRGDRGDVKK